MNIQLANYFVMIVVGGGAHSVTCPVSKAVSITTDHFIIYFLLGIAVAWNNENMTSGAAILLYIACVLDHRLGGGRCGLRRLQPYR